MLKFSTGLFLFLVVLFYIFLLFGCEKGERLFLFSKEYKECVYDCKEEIRIHYNLCKEECIEKDMFSDFEDDGWFYENDNFEYEEDGEEDEEK
jgi:hypothetical protein